MKAILLSMDTLASLSRDERDGLADTLVDLADLLRSEETIEPEITGVDSFLTGLGLDPGPKV